MNFLYSENSLQPIAGIGATDISYEREEVPDYVFEWLTDKDGQIVQGVIRFKRHVATRGMSSKFGEYLAGCLNAKEPWARAMVAQMRGELETSGVL